MIITTELGTVVVTGTTAESPPKTKIDKLGDEGFRPELGQRIGPAWLQIVKILGDREWHLWRDIVATIHPDSGLLPKTVSNLLHSAVSHGYCQRSGMYSPNPTRDTRSIRLSTKGTS